MRGTIRDRYRTTTTVDYPCRGRGKELQWPRPGRRAATSSAARGPTRRTARTFDVLDPFSRRRRRPGSGRPARPTRGARSRPRRAAFPAWAATPPAQRQQIFLKAADLLDARHDEIADALIRESGATFGFAMFQLHFVPGPVPAGGRRGVPADRPGDPVRRPRRDGDGHPAPGRRGRRDRAVERGADPVGPVDHRAAGVRQHRRAEAVRGVAVGGRPAVGRDLRGGRAAARRAEHRHARRARARRRSATS